MELYRVYTSGSLAYEEATEQDVLDNWKRWADMGLVVDIRRVEKMEDDRCPFV